MVGGTHRVWLALAGLAVAVAGGCQSAGDAGTPLVFTQTPPPVQAAYTEQYHGTVIKTITRQSRGGQDYYTVKYAAADGADHDVVFNGAGDEIDKH